MLCSYQPWVQASYSPKLMLINQNPNISIPKSNTQFERKSFDHIDDDADRRKFALPSHVKSITSTSNPFVKHCLKLRNSSSYRHSHASALVVGTTPLRFCPLLYFLIENRSYWPTAAGCVEISDLINELTKFSPHLSFPSFPQAIILREIYRYKEASQEKTVIECLLLLDKAEIPEGLDTHSGHVVRVSSTVMKKLSGVQSTESIEAIALMRFPTSFLNLAADQNKSDSRRWFPSTHRILVLDGIQDPGNLGTLIRSAMAFQWGGIFLLPGCCDPFNEKALRASRGASFQLPIVSGSWNHLETLKGTFNMKMLAGHPDTDWKTKKPFSLSQEFVRSLTHSPLCLVLGSEGRGLSEKSQLECELVSIPMSGKFESLNVSVAGGIFLYMLQTKN